MSEDAFDYWYPLYPARFKKKTLHLTLIQRGIYRELIDFYMETRSPLPNSDIALARIVGISVEEFTPQSAIIRAFFKVKKDTLFHPTCEGILRDQEERAKKRKEITQKAGKTSAEKRKQKQGQSNIMLNTSPTHVDEISTTGQDSKEQDRKVENHPTPSQPLVKKPPLPPRAAAPPASQGSGGFKKLGEGLGGLGLPGVTGSARAFDIRDKLEDHDFQELYAILPLWDRKVLFDQYNAWIAKVGEPNNPRAAFMAWCKKKPKQP